VLLLIICIKCVSMSFDQLYNLHMMQPPVSQNYFRVIYLIKIDIKLRHLFTILNILLLTHKCLEYVSCKIDVRFRLNLLFLVSEWFYCWNRA